MKTGFVRFPVRTGLACALAALLAASACSESGKTKAETVVPADEFEKQREQHAANIKNNIYTVRPPFMGLPWRIKVAPVYWSTLSIDERTELLRTMYIVAYANQVVDKVVMADSSGLSGGTLAEWSPKGGLVQR